MDDVLRRLAAVGPFFTVPFGTEPPAPVSSRSPRCTGSGSGRTWPRWAGGSAPGPAGWPPRPRSSGSPPGSGRWGSGARRCPAGFRTWPPIGCGGGCRTRDRSSCGCPSPPRSAGRSPRGERPGESGGARRGPARGLRGLVEGPAGERGVRARRGVAGADRPGAGRRGRGAGGRPAGRRRSAGGTGTFLHEEGLGVAFVRRSCCLYYQVPGGGLCGDCVLRTGRRRG